MNAFVATLCREVICAAAAIVISLVVGTSFLQSTAVAQVPATSSAAVVQQS
jgi:hypothetical protein